MSTGGGRGSLDTQMGVLSVLVFALALVFYTMGLDKIWDATVDLFYQRGER